uniref:DUF7835 family putative zinc beta-ribbon protein n=1 Tax=Halorussus amylolyticus TaxID=1126242 RepID=UPI00104FB6B2|nr:hypothetical protein [Halorussus amylolyticus]
MSLRESSPDESQGAFSEVFEECPNCERETPHDVRVRIRTESPASEFAMFSREPYRVTECRDCGRTEKVRMNNV